jgi:hypothetical protein
MKYADEIAPDGMMYILRFTTIHSGIEVTLRLLSQQYERLHCRYY